MGPHGSPWPPPWVPMGSPWVHMGSPWVPTGSSRGPHAVPIGRQCPPSPPMSPHGVPMNPCFCGSSFCAVIGDPPVAQSKPGSASLAMGLEAVMSESLDAQRKRAAAAQRAEGQPQRLRSDLKQKRHSPLSPNGDPMGSCVPWDPHGVVTGPQCLPMEQKLHPSGRGKGGLDRLVLD